MRIMRVMVVAAATCMLAMAPAVGQEPKKAATKVTISQLLKQGFEIRGLMGNADDLRNRYGFLAGAGVVLQKGARVFVCDGLFPEAASGPGGPPCAELKYDGSPLPKRSDW